jgi:hypothetical protein
VTSQEIKELEQEVSGATRSSIEGIVDYQTHNGDLNNHLDFWRGGARLNYKWRGSTLLYLQGTETFFMPQGRILDEHGTNLTAGIKEDVSDAVEAQFQGGATRFSNGGTTVNGLVGVRYNAPGGSVLYVRGNRTNVEESLLSAAGIRPVAGPFAGQLVGQVMDNRGVVGGTLRLSNHFDVFAEGGAGVRTGRNVDSNFFKEANGGAGVNLITGSSDSSLSLLRVSYMADYFGFDKNLLGFGGVSFLDASGSPVPVSQLGSDDLSPATASGNPGVGGYFSPSRFLSNVGRLELRGRPSSGFEYYLSGFAGEQNYTGTSTRAAEGFLGTATFLLSPRFSVPITYARENFGPFVQQSIFFRLSVAL